MPTQLITLSSSVIMRMMGNPHMAGMYAWLKSPPLSQSGCRPCGTPKNANGQYIDINLIKRKFAELPKPDQQALATMLDTKQIDITYRNRNGATERKVIP